MILGDDNLQGDRATRAAELYRAHWAPRVIASGRPIRSYISVPDLMRRDLEMRGVPDSAITSYPRPVENTREEAEALRKLAMDKGWRHVLIVTSSYHTRRSRFIFNRVWPKDYEFRMIAAHDSDYDPDSWWRTREGLKLVFHETVGFVVAAWELRHSD
ncbi:MAG TPA: YdcF family protein [Patescibacteria group bacterium]|nr:YdcF family protein [Patescibacteria group bacterium]